MRVRRDLGQAVRRQVAGASAAEAAAGQPHAHLPLGHASAHAIAEAQRARLRVELECRGLARHPRVAADGREIVDAVPGLVAAAGLFDLHLQRRGIDGALRQRERLIGRAGRHAQHAAAERRPLIDVGGVDADPGQRQAIDLLAGPRAEPEPGEQPCRSSGIVDAWRRVADARGGILGDVVRRRRRSAIRRAATGAAHPGGSGRSCRRRRATDRASGNRSRRLVRPWVVISHITGTGDGADTSSRASGIFMAGTTPIEISDGAPVSPPPSAARTSSLTVGCWSGRGASGARSAIHNAWSALSANTSMPPGSARPASKTGMVW